MKKFTLVFAALVFSLSNAFALDYQFQVKSETWLGEKRSYLYFESAGKSVRLAPIEVLKQGTELYHWGSEHSIRQKLESFEKIKNQALSRQTTFGILLTQLDSGVSNLYFDRSLGFSQLRNPCFDF